MSSPEKIRPEVLPSWFNQNGFNMNVEGGFDPNDKVLKISGYKEYFNNPQIKMWSSLSIEPFIKIDERTRVWKHLYAVHFYSSQNIVGVSDAIDLNRSELILAFNLNGKTDSPKHDEFKRYKDYLHFNNPKKLMGNTFLGLSIHLYDGTKNAVRDFLFIKEVEYLNLVEGLKH